MSICMFSEYVPAGILRPMLNRKDFEYCLNKQLNKYN